MHPTNLVIAGIDPSRQLIYGFIQAGFVLLHVQGPLRVAQVVYEIRANLQPPGHVLLQNLLVKIVHVVIVLHRDALWSVLRLRRNNNNDRMTVRVAFTTRGTEMWIKRKSNTGFKDTWRSVVSALTLK